MIESQFVPNPKCRFFFFSATDCWVTAHLLVFFPQADEEYLLQYPIKNTSYGTLHTRTLGLRFQVGSNTTRAQKRRWNCDTLRNLCFPCRLKGSIFLPKTATWSLNVQPPSETFIGRLTKNLPKASKVKGTPTQFTIHLCVSKMVDPKVSLECMELAQDLDGISILFIFQP